MRKTVKNNHQRKGRSASSSIVESSSTDVEYERMRGWKYTFRTAFAIRGQLIVSVITTYYVRISKYTTIRARAVYKMPFETRWKKSYWRVLHASMESEIIANMISAT